jgi:hypothetical protein
MPTARYQHGAVFVGARLHISGGAVGGGRMVDDASSIVALDTAAGTWCTQAEPPAGAGAGNGNGGAASGTNESSAAEEEGGEGSSANPGEDWSRRCACWQHVTPAPCGGSWPTYGGIETLLCIERSPQVALADVCLRACSRCRHAVAAVGPYVFIYGGLRGSALLDDFLLADDSSGSELSICDPRSNAWCAQH